MEILFIELRCKLSRFQYFWNLGRVWVGTVCSMACYQKFIIQLFSVAGLRYFHLSCRPLILHVLFSPIYWSLIFNFIHSDIILMQPKQLASVKVLLIYTAIRESRLLSSCYSPSVSGSSAVCSTASFEKSSFQPLYSDYVFCAKLNKSCSVPYSFFFFTLSIL